MFLRELIERTINNAKGSINNLNGILILYY